MPSNPSQLAGEKSKCRFIPRLCILRRAIQRLFKSWNCHKNQAALLQLPEKVSTWIISTKKSSNFSELCSLASGTKAVLVSYKISSRLQCCSQIFTEMRINFQVVSKLNSLYFKNHQNFVLGASLCWQLGNFAIIVTIQVAAVPADPYSENQWIQICALWPQCGSIQPAKG